MMTFDRLAPFYRALEMISAGGKLQRCRRAFLAEIPPPRKVLLAGEGYGSFLPECARRFPESHIVVVDSSQRMLEIAQTKAAPSQADFVHADLLEWMPSDGGFDLIVTHFFLDCFTADQLAALILRLANLAGPNAHWLLSDFEIAPANLARWRSRMILALLYRFFRITCGMQADTLVPPDADLERAGFSLHRRKSSDWGLLKSEWWRRDSALKA